MSSQKFSYFQSDCVASYACTIVVMVKILKLAIGLGFERFSSMMVWMRRYKKMVIWLKSPTRPFRNFLKALCCAAVG